MLANRLPSHPTIGETLWRVPAVARLDVECLLQRVLRMRKEQLYAHREQKLTRTQRAHLHDLLLRRQRGEPIAYLVGEKEFYGRSFYVDKDVLIPRPETEQLITAAKKNFPATADLHILDIGTGSGCLAITLACEFPHSQVTAWEISTAALAVAARNATQHNCHNITFVQHDMFTDPPPTATLFDLIVANPPYILPREQPSLSAAVRDYEPHLALFTDRHGLAHYRRLAALAVQLLKEEGELIIELNPHTAQATEKAFLAQGLVTTAAVRDLHGLVRTLTLCKTLRATN